MKEKLNELLEAQGWTIKEKEHDFYNSFVTCILCRPESQDEFELTTESDDDIIDEITEIAMKYNPVEESKASAINQTPAEIRKAIAQKAEIKKRLIAVAVELLKYRVANRTIQIEQTRFAITWDMADIEALQKMKENCNAHKNNRKS